LPLLLPFKRVAGSPDAGLILTGKAINPLPLLPYKMDMEMNGGQMTIICSIIGHLIQLSITKHCLIINRLKSGRHSDVKVSCRNTTCRVILLVCLIKGKCRPENLYISLIVTSLNTAKQIYANRFIFHNFILIKYTTRNRHSSI
jgi:hypothetical protein